VYGLIDPRNRKIFYIGKGTGNRVFEHERESLSREKKLDKPICLFMGLPTRKTIKDSRFLKVY